MLDAGIKEEFEQYMHNTELAPSIADKCTQHYHLTRTSTKGFKFCPREFRVSFNLCENAFTLSLHDFSYARKIPCWGLLDEPPTCEYVAFLTSLCFGEDRGVTQGRINSIHFPSIRYLALFNGKCILANKLVVLYVPHT